MKVMRFYEIRAWLKGSNKQLDLLLSILLSSKLSFLLYYIHVITMAHILEALQDSKARCHSKFVALLGKNYNYHSHFTDEEVETQFA